MLPFYLDLTDHIRVMIRQIQVNQCRQTFLGFEKLLFLDDLCDLTDHASFYVMTVTV